MILAKQLGMIPAWQFNDKWDRNPNFNRHVIYPEGQTQMTVQPIGPNYAPPEFAVVGPAGTAGFGAAFGRKAVWRPRRANEANCCENCACGSACTGCPDPGVVAQINQSMAMRGLGSPLDFFESPVWANRKWIVAGGAALLGLAVIGGLTAILR